jgi:hypothetical protein
MEDLRVDGVEGGEVVDVVDWPEGGGIYCRVDIG